MKALIAIVFLILTSGYLLAQPVPQWSSSINSNFILYTRDKPQIKFDNSGDLIVVGNVNNEAIFNGKDILLLKYSPLGDVLWQQVFNGINNYDDQANDFEIDAQNNIIITGSSVIDSINTDMITIKYDANGNLKWINSFDGAINKIDAGKSIALNILGESYVTGFSSIDTLEHHQILTTKIDSAGNILWTHFYGSDTIATYEGEGIKLINNEVVIIGYFTHYNATDNRYVVLKLDTDGILTFSNEGEISRKPNCFYLDIFGNSYLGAHIYEGFKLTKINPLGLIVWSDLIPTNSPSNVFSDKIQAIIVDSLQNVYVTGNHRGDDYGGLADSNQDILTIKYSSSGSPLWSNRYENLSNNAADIGQAITIDNNRNVYVAGQSQRNNVGTDYDYVVVKYDSNGNEKGTIRYNDIANGIDSISSIAVDDSSNIYVTGLTFENFLSSTTTQKYSSVVEVSISEINNDMFNLSALPNPFSTTTSIQFSNMGNELFIFKLFDISGGIILNIETNSDNIEISSNNLPNGLYTFVLHSVKQIYYGKIIISR